MRDMQWSYVLLENRLGQRGVEDDTVVIREHIGLPIHIDAENTELVTQCAVGFCRIFQCNKLRAVCRQFDCVLLT